MAGGGCGSRSARLCLCLLLAFAVVCSARNTIFLSEEETTTMIGAGLMEGRSLKILLNDYASASANSNHNPKPPAPIKGRG